MKKIICIMIMFCFVLTGCNTGYWKEYSTNECVKEKWIKGVGQEGQKYLIGTESGEVYQITDSLFKWQFTSSDIYNKITEGECYDITYFGWRIGFFSTYKVIYDLKEIN